jgi:hypothetical protein
MSSTQHVTTREAQFQMLVYALITSMVSMCGMSRKYVVDLFEDAAHIIHVYIAEGMSDDALRQVLMQHIEDCIRIVQQQSQDSVNARAAVLEILAAHHAAARRDTDIGLDFDTNTNHAPENRTHRATGSRNTSNSHVTTEITMKEVAVHWNTVGDIARTTALAQKDSREGAAHTENPDVLQRQLSGLHMSTQTGELLIKNGQIAGSSETESPQARPPGSF